MGKLFASWNHILFKKNKEQEQEGWCQERLGWWLSEYLTHTFLFIYFPFGVILPSFSPWQKSAGTDATSICPTAAKFLHCNPWVCGGSKNGNTKLQMFISVPFPPSFPYVVSRNVIPGHSDMYKEREQKVVDQSTNCYSHCSGEQLLKSICR